MRERSAGRGGPRSSSRRSSGERGGSSFRGGDRGDRGDRRGGSGGPRRGGFRSTKFYILKEGDKVDYKNLVLLQKYLSDRGKVLSRRFTGVSAKDQRKLMRAIKRARFLGLLAVGRSK